MLNAKVTNVKLGIEDRGGLVVTISLEGKGWGCCYCSGSLAYESWGTDKIYGVEETASKIYELLNFFRVSDLNQIKDKYLRVEFTNEVNGTIVKLIDIFDDNRTFTWFNKE